jgi:hypothetical protein
MSRRNRLGASLLAVTLSCLALLALPTTAQAAEGEQLSITNLDVVPSNNTAIMSKIQNPADSSQRWHDKVTLRLTNTGTTGLTVTSLATTGPFTLSSPWKLPFRLTSGGSVNLTVTFTATSGAWHTGTGTVHWDPGTPTSSSINLAGWWQKYSEKGLEPWLPDLVRHSGYRTVMPSAMYSRGAYQAFSTDEVLTPYWSLRNPAQPARITQLGAWRGYPTNVVVRSHERGNSGATTQVFSGLKNDSQSILPRNTSWLPGTATFLPSGPFGLKIDDEFTDPALNDQAVDRAAGCRTVQCGHRVRVFKLRDDAGREVPGSYLLAQDFGGINYDYNDNVFLVENLTPAPATA